MEPDAITEAPRAMPEPALSKMAIAALWYASKGLPVFPLAPRS